MFWAHFHDFCVQKRSCLPWSPGAFWSFSLCKLKKCSGRIFSIFASKNEGICCEVQTHFGRSLPARFTEKSSGRNVRIYVSEKEAVCCEVQTHLGSFRLARLQKKFWAHFLDFCVQKRSCLLWSSDAFLTFSPCMLYKKVLGVFSRFMRPKMKLFAMEFRHILEVLCLRVLQKVLGAIPRFMRPKIKLFALKFRRILEVLCLWVLQKVLGAIPRFVRPKNETVCCEIQTHFGSSPPPLFYDFACRCKKIF